MMNTHVRRVFKKALALCGGSAPELARRLGLDRGTVGRWERGSQAPSGESLYLLLEFVARAERAEKKIRPMSNITHEIPEERAP